MRRAPLLLALLVVALLAALGWYALGPGHGPGTAVPPQAVPRQASTPVSPAPQAPLGADGGVAEGVPVQAARTSASPGGSPGEAPILRGRVELAQDCRREDGLRVYALDRAVTAEQLAAALYAERHGEPPSEQDSAGGGTVSRGAAAEAARILARTTTDGEGRFELRLEGRVEGPVHLSALGRYAYLADSRALDPTGAQGEVGLGLSCGAELVGQLVPPPGADPASVAGTEVRVRLAAMGRPGAGLARRTHADASGRFELGGLPVRLELEVLAKPDAYPYARQDLGRLEAGTRREIRLTLAQGARVMGVVLDEDGVPVPRAKVEVLPEGSLFDLEWATRTLTCDAEGRFDLGGLQAGPMLVRGSARGFLESALQRFEIAEGAARSGIELRLSRGASIAGRARWPDGRPVVDGSASARFDPTQSLGMGAYSAMRGGRGDARTDAEGRFRIGGLGRGPFVVSLEATPPADLPGADGEAWVAHLPSMSPDGPELEVVLAAPEGIRGQVLSVQGSPIERFRIHAIRTSTNGGVELGVETQERGFEDGEGRFRFAGLAPGKWRFFAAAEGFARSAALTLDLPQPTDAEPVRFELERAARVEGIVLGFDGRPVGEAQVSLADDQPGFMRLMGAAPDPPGSRTDASGRFRIVDLPPGSLSLVAKAEGYASSTPRSLELAPDQELRGLELVLREGGRIEGLVYDAEGRPARGATVQLLHTADMDWRFERTDGEGRFLAARLDPGTWRALYMPRGFGTESFASAEAENLDVGELMRDMAIAMADVEDGRTVQVVLGAPPEDPVRVRGRVLLAGDPYPGAIVAFYREGTKALERMRAASSKEDGTFEVLLDAPGAHVVQIQKIGAVGGQQSSVEITVDVPKVAEHELLLELPGGRISGRLLGPGGEPAAGVRVTLVGAGAQESGLFFGGHYSELASDEAGRYEIVGLGPGAYHLAVGGMTSGGFFGADASHARQVRLVELSRDEHARDVDFRLRAPAKLSVRVVDEIGEPVVDAAVFVRDAHNGTLLERMSLITTGPQGVCEYGGLSPGRYTVSARKAGRASADSGSVEVRAEGTASVQVVLQEGTLLKLELLDDEGEPLRARYSVRDADGREYQGMFAMEDLMQLLGKVELASNQPQVGPLAPGEYTVEARAADGRSAQRPVSLRGQRERVLRLRLR